MKRDISYNSDTAWIETITIDLADKSTVQKYISTQSLAPFSSLTMSIRTSGCVGTSGNVTLEQSASASGKPSSPMATPITVALGENVNVFDSGILEQEYAVVDMSLATLGVVGTMIITVHARR